MVYVKSNSLNLKNN